MSKQRKTLSAVFSILFVITTVSITYGGAKNIPDTKENLKNLTEKCPTLVESWQKAIAMTKEIRKSEHVFGIPDRAMAEKNQKKIISAYSSEKTKFSGKYTTCHKRLTGELNKTTRKLKNLEKKKKLTQSMQTSQEELQTKASKLRGMLNKAENMHDPFPLYRLADEISRLQIVAGEVARKQVIASAPNLIKYRMALQDNLVDIERLQKVDHSKMTMADKQKLKKSLQQLKINYKKVTTTAAKRKAPLTTQTAKFEKKINSLKVKAEKAEKANRSTDKLDLDRLRLMGEVRMINYQLVLIDKITNIPKAEELLATSGK